MILLKARERTRKMTTKRKSLKHSKWQTSFYTAMQGFFLAFRQEASVRRAVFFAVLFIGITCMFHSHYWEVLIIILAWLQVVVYEMFNTAIENVLDYTSNNEYNILIKHAKDFSAGSVFIASVLGVIIFLIIMWNYFV